MSDDALKVVLPRMLAADADGERTVIVEATDVATIEDLLALLAQRYPLLGRRLRDETGALRRFVNVYVQGEDVRQGAGMDTAVHAGQEVMIIQSVAGG